MPKKTCFVVQGFGEKTDFPTGRKLNLDASYNVIKKAVEDAGLACIRADEIQHAGTIDKPMYEQILAADLVIADLSTYNVNAAYELGVRYALCPHATIIIAEKGFQYPFDFSHITIRSYEHLGSDIGFQEALRFCRDLTEAIEAILATPKTDSPVYTFLPELQPPRPQAAKAGEGLPSPGAPGPMPKPAPGGYSATAPGARAGAAAASEQNAKMLLDQGKAAIQRDDFMTAKGLFLAVHAMRPNDAYALQQLTLATYKSKQPDERSALMEAHGYLLKLHPDTSNDPETLGLLGAIHKRLWKLIGDREDLDKSIASYERGFYLRNDYYNGTNLAFLFNLRAHLAAADGDVAEAIADFVLARRIRQRLIPICRAALETSLTKDEQYWILATLWETAFALGGDDVEAWKQQAVDTAPAAWMIESTESQIAALAELLEKSPLEHLG